MGAGNQFESHGTGSVLAILNTAGRTEPALAAEWNKLKVATMGTSIHCPAKRRIAAVNHLIYVVDDGTAGM